MMGGGVVSGIDGGDVKVEGMLVDERTGRIL